MHLARRGVATTSSGKRRVLSLTRALRAAGSPARAASEKKYLRGEFEHFGVAVPVIRKLTRAAYRGLELSRSELIVAVELLWKRGVHELRVAAVQLLVDRVSLLTAADLALVERLIRAANTWALIDELAPRVAADLFERFPKLSARLDHWACDDDFWVRRASLLVFLLPLRRGEGDFQRFARYADAMLDEKEFFIRKAIGWVLRETSKKRPALVYEWLLPRMQRASGVTIREALRYLSDTQQRKLLSSRLKSPAAKPSATDRRRRTR